MDNELDVLAALPPKDKQPPSANVLSQWVRHAATKGRVSEARLSWLIASSVVIGALQQVKDSEGRARFLLKGGTMLMHRLGATARPTRDVDGILRGDIDAFLHALDDILARDWSPLELWRTDVELIRVPHLVVPPRRLEIKIALRGKVWRSVRVEASPDEGGATAEDELVDLPSLRAVGLTAPDKLACLALRYQIAQKVHAATDPHEPPDRLNDRARDIVDLLALLQFEESAGVPTTAQMAEACRDIFASRAARAAAAGANPRPWPPQFVAYPHWASDYARAAGDTGAETVPLDDAVSELNSWIASLP